MKPSLPFGYCTYVPETKGLDQESMSAFWRRQAGLSAAPAS